MGIKQRAYPSPGQVPVLVSHLGQARFIYNLALEQRSYWKQWRRPFKQQVNTATQMRELTELRAEVDWLSAGSTVVQQGALRDLDAAFTNFFEGRAGYPKFKKRTDEHSFRIRDLKVRRLSDRRGEVFVPKVGWVGFTPTRPWREIKAATSARMSRDPSGRWHVSFTTKPGDFARDTTQRVVGIDRGARNSIATSDGDLDSTPSLTPGEQKRFLALSQRKARQDAAAKARRSDARRAGASDEEVQAAGQSNRREATRLALAKLHARLGDRRRNWVEKTTTDLVRRYDVVAIEKLPTAGMTRKPKPKPDPEQPGAFLPNGAKAKAALNKAILASCWGEFEKRLKDKASRTPERASCEVVPVNPKNTSRRCSACGHVAAENRQSQAVFVCQACGHEAHADINAAINILHRALAPAGGPPNTQPADGGGSDASPASIGEPRQPNTLAA